MSGRRCCNIYLDVFALLVACGFAEEWPHDDAEGVQFSNNRVSGGGGETGEDDELVVLA